MLLQFRKEGHMQRDLMEEEKEKEKQSDIRVPLVFSIFCLCVIAGGVFLVIYVFFNHLSKPWYPVAAFCLIGSPWIFWFLTYIYSCMKGCCCRRGKSNATVGHQISRRQTTLQNNTQRVGSSREPEMPLAYSA